MFSKVIFSFLSTPSARRATSCGGYYASAAAIFLSTPSARRATVKLSLALLTAYDISIHALREEGDVGVLHPNCMCPIFLSTPSARRATIPYITTVNYSVQKFLSTPSARRATVVGLPLIVLYFISIHALREEGDAILQRNQNTVEDISIHALREEGDRWQPRPRSGTAAFLSTPSARRATHPLAGPERQEKNFYPRPPRGGRPAYRPSWTRRGRNFYPRPPRGGRPEADDKTAGNSVISIHALREEGDRT